MIMQVIFTGNAGMEFLSLVKIQANITEVNIIYVNHFQFLIRLKNCEHTLFGFTLDRNLNMTKD